MNKDKIQEYVYKNYKSLKGKPLIITENNACIMVRTHVDGPRLILGKNVVK